MYSLENLDYVLALTIFVLGITNIFYMLISLIIPVYNRPQETEELLASLLRQTRRDFEVVIVDDGSAHSLTSREIAAQYAGRLDIKYVYQDNAGPAGARNTGAANARGDFFVIMDSDCIVPKHYFEIVYSEIESKAIEFYGGPDSAARSFSDLQKAVSYSMTSLFTTGGIRGNKKGAGSFTPRSFNLGISRRLFEQVGGFEDMRIGEDIDFSTRVKATGVKVWFLPKAVVCHKRRTSLRLFFKQVFIFGVARVNLDIKHPKARKPIFLLPSLFTLGSAALLIAVLFSRPLFWLPVAAIVCLCLLGSLSFTTGGGILAVFSVAYCPLWFWLPFVLLMALWFVDSWRQYRDAKIAWLSIWTSFIQLYGYGAGYLYGIYMRRIRHYDEQATYKVTKFFPARRQRV